MADPQHAAPGSSKSVTFQLEVTKFPEQFDISSDPEDPNPDGDGSETRSRPFRVLCFNKKDRFIALAIFLFGVALSCAYYFTAEHLYRPVPLPPWAYWRLRKSDNGIPRILLWNRIMKPLSFDLNVPDLHKRWSSNVTTCLLDGEGPVRCEITDNRTRFMWSDAVVFEADRLNVLDLPKERRELPAHPEFPMWILWAENHYPPLSTFPDTFGVGTDGQGIGPRFNWTMGHREDADIVVPYKLWRCGVPGDPSAAEYAEHNRKTIPRFRRLTQAAWIMGTCEEHAYQLMRYRGMQEEPHYPSLPLIDLDVFPDCARGTCETRRECLRYIAANYRFVFVRLQPDCFHSQYEVIYDAFEYDLVPVVLAPPNTNLNVPPHSVVSSADLQQPGELSAYLHSLMKNPVEYERYFEWKKHCSLIPNNFDLCPLCRAFHEKHARQQKHPDAYAWWKGRIACYGPTPPLHGLDWAFVHPRSMRHSFESFQYIARPSFLPK